MRFPKTPIVADRFSASFMNESKVYTYAYRLINFIMSIFMKSICLVDVYRAPKVYAMDI